MWTQAALFVTLHFHCNLRNGPDKLGCLPLPSLSIRVQCNTLAYGYLPADGDVADSPQLVLRDPGHAGVQRGVDLARVLKHGKAYISTLSLSVCENA